MPRMCLVRFPGLGWVLHLPERQLPSQHRAWYSARAGQAEERRKQNVDRKCGLLAVVSGPAISISLRVPEVGATTCLLQTGHCP